MKPANAGRKTMAKQRLRGLHSIEGRHVSVSLRDGTRIDDCELVSGGRTHAPSLWLFTNGEDRFVALTEVVDVWETEVRSPRAA
jgi:hypothetical protein